MGVGRGAARFSIWSWLATVFIPDHIFGVQASAVTASCGHLHYKTQKLSVRIDTPGCHGVWNLALLWDNSS